MEIKTNFKNVKNKIHSRDSKALGVGNEDVVSFANVSIETSQVIRYTNASREKYTIIYIIKCVERCEPYRSDPDRMIEVRISCSARMHGGS